MPKQARTQRRPMRRLVGPIVALSLSCGFVLQSAAAPPAALTPEQRAEIVQVVREALRTDPTILRDALAALQSVEDAQQDAAVSGVIAVQRAALTADPADPVQGNPAGTTTVVEFYDPRCPYCRQMLPVFEALLQSDPQIRLVLKDIPILGPASVLESRALLAAHRQGGYLKLQAALMRSGGTPTPASVRDAAERVGLDGARLEHDLADPAIQARLDQNLRLAAMLHLEGTPAIIVGNRLLPGAVSLSALQSAIAAARRP